VSGNPFVKSATTTTPVSNSKAELEQMLRRYGAEGYSVAHNYALGKVLVSFLIPDSTAKGAAIVPVQVNVDVQGVYRALYGKPPHSGYDAKLMEKAERVAWRNLILWVDAQLSAATIGLQTITEGFLAHAVIGPNGERGADYLPHLLDSSRMLRAGDTNANP
jgi:hypothetical protein